MQQAISNDLHSIEDEIMKKVLIVDDEEDMIWSLQKNLPNRTLQVETLTASSGEEALDVLNQTDVDLIVTDIKMPGMSGLDLLSEVNSRYPHLEVIVMTAYSSQEWETEAIIRGGYSYIEKPFDINEMRRVINQALQCKEDTMHGDIPDEDNNDISTLEMKITPADENEPDDYIVKPPKNVQAVLSEEGDIEESIVNTLLNFSIEDLINEDDLVNDETFLADGRSIEDAIVESLTVTEESKLATTDQVRIPVEKDETVMSNLESSGPEDDESASANQKTNTPESDDPLQTKPEASAPEDDETASANQETSTLENDEPAETVRVTGAQETDEAEETKWVINTRDRYEPEDTVQETQEPDNDEAEEPKWVIKTRDDYEPAQTKWVINTRDNKEPTETVRVTGAQETDEAEETKWVIKTRDN